ncbi:MAG: hypothetical protein JSV23_01385 [Promethearchaeota archaeon]|nr:MAG: hypothetical protein JSV23_01385 [Candidatus Lokiarchaeota archaeon]
MMREVQERIHKLELSIYLREDHLRKYAHLIESRPLRFITNQIKQYKRVLQIRKDYPIL